MKGYCPMCLHDHDATCEIDETTVTWYTHKIQRQFLEKKLKMFGDRGNEYYHGAQWITIWLKELEGED